MIYTIPLQPVRSQQISILLNNQPCSIDLGQLGGRQYLSLSLNGEVVCNTVLLVNRSRIIRAEYMGFMGDLAVIDTQGDEPPQYTGWNDRWLLAFNTEN